MVESEVPEGFSFISLGTASKEELLKYAPEADYFIVSGRLPVDEQAVSAAKKLKMVQRTGVGTDQIDIDALKSRNIPLSVNKGVNAAAVAEHTLLLILALYRKLVIADSLIKKGGWKKQALGIQTRTLFKKKVGLIGLGNIGAEFVKLLQPFGVDILYHKRARLDSEIEKKYGLTFTSKEKLLAESDVVCLMCAYSEATHHIIDKESLALMKPESLLINTARGKLIDETPFLEALKQNRISGAGLDVFTNEPLPEFHEIRNLSNVVLTSHIAGITRESFIEMYRRAFKKIVNFDRANQ